MREIVFIQKNKARWNEFEAILSSPKVQDPDELAALYIQLTDDLSYASTYYPDSNITTYLNQLSQQVHRMVHKNNKVKKGAFKHFWLTDLPLVLYRERRNLLYSFVITMVAVMIGVVSASGDETFVRTILGDAYVDMTIQNIMKNDPMAVYKQASETSMFLGITINNVKVSFMAFVLGFFFSVGTGFVLFQNGVMLGSFMTFFAKYGLFWESTRVIWIHGALEISAIVIAGGAGLVLGNSILFPGTLSRKKSMIAGVRRGIKIISGLVPVFITAGFLEGFVTRHTEMPVLLSWTIILVSFAFIIWYFILYPRKVNKKLFTKPV